ncbi:hypothetical protein K490DRAFT_55229 [Saccharata proteae CBS 121410]|uniref:Secreted protein n=1 Tax=Saccharata proteae CBS 121410 TaxID=1314787 RepID=A0A6A5YCM4_9PEZI|nr:hypothetical protein K490DRAFT_55229 [Saccharata proteae CBS 121410]
MCGVRIQLSHLLLLLSGPRTFAVEPATGWRGVEPVTVFLRTIHWRESWCGWRSGEPFVLCVPRPCPTANAIQNRLPKNALDTASGRVEPRRLLMQTQARPACNQLSKTAFPPAIHHRHVGIGIGIGISARANPAPQIPMSQQASTATVAAAQDSCSAVGTGIAACVDAAAV